MNLTKKKLLLVTTITLLIPQFFYAKKKDDDYIYSTSDAIFIHNNINAKTHVLAKYAVCRSWSNNLAPQSFVTIKKSYRSSGFNCIPKHIYFTIYHPIGENQFIPLEVSISLKDNVEHNNEKFFIQGPFTTKQDNKIHYTVRRKFKKRTHRDYSVFYESSK